jgi:hypothetical protein
LKRRHTAHSTQHAAHSTQRTAHSTQHTAHSGARHHVPRPRELLVRVIAYGRAGVGVVQTDGGLRNHVNCDDQWQRYANLVIQQGSAVLVDEVLGDEPLGGRGDVDFSIRDSSCRALFQFIRCLNAAEQRSVGAVIHTLLVMKSRLQSRACNTVSTVMELQTTEPATVGSHILRRRAKTSSAY